MGKFEVGTRVKILTNMATDHYNQIGTIVDIDDDEDYEVIFSVGDPEYFGAHEMELAPAEAPATETAPAPEGVHDVQCRCGYMASQHWADGECPGDGYPYADAPENHIEPELPYARFMEILREVLHFPQDDAMFSEWAIIEAIRQDNAIIMTQQAETERLRAELTSVRAENARLQDNYDDCSNAIAAILKERGVEFTRVGEYEIYLGASGGADAIHVDANGNRVQQARQDAG